MTAFRALLDDLADQAKVYDVTDRAVAVARRRRRLHQAVPAAVALLVFGVGAAAWVPLHRNGPAPSAVDSWLPARISAPTNVPPLSDTPVGAGVLIYFQGIVPSGPIREPALLVTTTGRQYRLPSEAGQANVVSLSPNGRWLVYLDAGTAYLRDLAGTSRRPLPVLPSSVAWSANAQWLAVEQNTSGGRTSPPWHTVTRLNLRTGAVNTYQLKCCFDAKPVSGIRDDGRLVFETEIGGRAGPTGNSVEFDVNDVDPAADRPNPGSITLSMHAGVSASDPNAKWLVLVENQIAPGGTRLLFVNAGKLTMVDLITMKILRVYQVPVSQGAISATGGSHTDSWWLGGLVPQGVLLVHQWYAAGQYQTSLELLDLTTGKHRLVTRFAVAAGKVVLR